MADDADGASADSRGHTRRAILAASAAAGGAGIASALSGSGTPGNLWGGTMALSEAFNVSGELWIGPDSAKSNVDATDGRVYMASDTQVEYYGDGGSWTKLGVGSSSEPVPSVHTDDLQSNNPPIQSGHANMAEIGVNGRSELQSKAGGYTKPVIMLHFDDGLTSHYEERDYFAGKNVKPGFAVRPGEMGDAGRLTWAQTEELQDEYDFEINSHGHGDWGRFGNSTDEEIENEVVEAQREFSENGVYARHYVYANGETGGAVGQGVVSDFYPAGWGTSPSTIRFAERYDLPRRSMDGTSRSTLESDIDEAIANNTGLVLYGHEIIENEANEDSQSTSKEKLDHIISYARTNGAEFVDTSAEVLRYSWTTWGILNENLGGLSFQGGRVRLTVPAGERAMVLDPNGNELMRWEAGGTRREYLESFSSIDHQGNGFRRTLNGSTYEIDHTNGSHLFRPAGHIESTGGGPAPQPEDLTVATGNVDGEIRTHDGSGTPPFGAAQWDNTNSQWVSLVDASTF